MGMVAAGYGDSLRGGIMSLNALKNERACKLESNHSEIQCLEIIIGFLNVWNKFCLNLKHFSK